MNPPGNIRITNHRRSAHIDIEGTIGSPDSGTSYPDFIRQLRQLHSERLRQLHISIRSVGGSVADALLIHDSLCELSLRGIRITTSCHGYTASAATIIAQAASPGQRMIAPGALYLIHNSTASLDHGNSNDTLRAAELLRQTDLRLASLYAQRSGRPQANFLSLMACDSGQGQWLSPEEAIEEGLADRITENSPLRVMREKIRNLFTHSSDLPQPPTSRKHDLPERLETPLDDTPQDQAGQTPAPRRDTIPVSPRMQALALAEAADREEQFRAEAARLDSEALRAQALPTATLPREDPGVVPIPGLVDSAARGNSTAYESDVQRLRSSYYPPVTGL